jgi:hypothetical protein
VLSKRVSGIISHNYLHIPFGLNLTWFRLSFGVIGRLPRVTPEPGAEFNGYSVPAGVCLKSQFPVLFSPPFLSPPFSLFLTVCVTVCLTTDSGTQNQTIVGMSSWMMHRNEDVFPNPEKFDPSRWLDPAIVRVLDKHLVTFGKGQRQCIGMPYGPLLYSSYPELILA